MILLSKKLRSIIESKVIIRFFLFGTTSLMMSYSSWGNNDNNRCHFNMADTIVIVAFGNSITAERSTVKKVFAQRLPELLLKNGVVSKVINSGIPGSHTGSIKDNDLFKIKHGLDRFETDVIAYRPDIVMIGFGTNDAHIDNVGNGGSSRISLNKYKTNLEYMINRLKDDGVNIILIAPNILGEKYNRIQNERLKKYVTVVRRLSKKYKTGLVDNYKLFLNYQKKTGTPFDYLMLDGVHPNDRGHELITMELIPEVIKLLHK